MYYLRRILNLKVSITGLRVVRPAPAEGVHEAQVLMHNHAALLPAGPFVVGDAVRVSARGLLSYGRQGVVVSVSSQALTVRLDGGALRIFTQWELSKEAEAA
jgi:hypothetical protein